MILSHNSCLIVREGCQEAHNALIDKSVGGQRWARQDSEAAMAGMPLPCSVLLPPLVSIILSRGRMPCHSLTLLMT